MGIPPRQRRAIPSLRCVNSRRLERKSLALWITVHRVRVDLASAERKAGINSSLCRSYPGRRQSPALCSPRPSRPGRMRAVIRGILPTL
jgi:hypothetical protein